MKINKQEIFDKLNKKVKGHSLAKKVLINQIARAKLARYTNVVLGDNQVIPRINSLLIGKSGTGKTYLVECLREVVKFPLYTIDATSLNPSGAEGDFTLEKLKKKINSFTSSFLLENKEDYFSEEGVLSEMVIFVDEIDKLGKRDYSGGWNQHVQANFLRFFEGKVKPFNTVSFIFAGAFMTMDRGITSNNTIGFFNHRSKSKSDGSLDEKLIEYGLLTELIGRINHTVELEVLTLNDYKELLVNTLIPKRQKMLSLISDNKFNLSDELVNKFAERALASDQGVRYLNKCLDDHLIDFEFNDTFDSEKCYNSI